MEINLYVHTTLAYNNYDFILPPPLLSCLPQSLPLSLPSLFPSLPPSIFLHSLQMSATDRGLVNAFRDIGTMADKLNLPRIIVVSSFCQT